MATAAPVSAAIRDQFGDHLITPKNSALVVIDYQPSQLAGVRSMDRDLLLKNVVSTVKVAKLFGLPIVHSTINVRTGRGKPTLPPLAELLADNPPILGIGKGRGLDHQTLVRSADTASTGLASDVNPTDILDRDFLAGGSR